MSLTVAQLIRKLKKFPPNMKVGFACHDNGDDEMAGHVSYIDFLADGEQKQFYGPTVILRG